MGGAIRAGKAFIELHADKSPLMKEMKTLGSSISSGLAAAGPYAAAAAAVATAIAAIGAAVGAAVNKFQEHGSALADMSQRTGVAGSVLSEYEHVASQTGTSLQDVEAAFSKMNKTVGDAKAGNKQAQESLAALGMSVEDLAGMAPDQMFESFADKIAGIEDPATKASTAMDVFGKSADKLFGMLNEGGEGIRELRQQARDLRLGWSDKDIERADALGDSLATTQAMLSRLVEKSVSSLAPAVTAVLDIINVGLTGLLGLVDEINAIIDDVAARLMDLIPVEWQIAMGVAWGQVKPGMKRPPPAFNPIEAAAEATKPESLHSLGGFNPFELSMQSWSGARPIVDAIKQAAKEAKENADRIVVAIEQAVGGGNFAWGP